MLNRPDAPNYSGNSIAPDETGNFERQHQLYDRFILPNEPDLQKLVLSIRKRVDAFYLEVQARLWYERPETTAEDVRNRDASQMFLYPDACCSLIVGKVLEHISALIPDEAPYVQEFVANGGIFERRWGSFHGSKKPLIQNFLQVGDRILDVAFEEMDPDSDRIVNVEPIAGGRYRALGYSQDDLRVTESYYEGARNVSAIGLLGRVACFYPVLHYHMPTGYMMRAGLHRGYGLEDSLRLLKEGGMVQMPADEKARIVRAIEDVLAFDGDDILGAHRFLLRRILNDTEIADYSSEFLTSSESWARDFITEHARGFECSEEEFFKDFSLFMLEVMGKVCDEHYDRLYAERTGKRTFCVPLPE